MERSPRNLRKLIIADAPVSMKLWEVAVNQLLDRPDPEHQAIKNALARLNPDKEEDQVEYAEWTQRFYDLHI